MNPAESTNPTANPAPTGTDAGIVVVSAAARWPQIQAALAKRALESVRRFDPRDINEVERAIAAGKVRRVIFPTSADFLQLLWSEELTPANWPAEIVQVEFADVAGSVDGRLAASFLAAWTAHLQQRRRARAIAGVVLSAFAILAAAVLLALAR